MSIEVSVIIPVYNDYDGLMTCLEALRQQTLPQDKFETIIVDNGSDPPVDDSAVSADNIRLAVEYNTGSYAARNKGVRLATGEIIAFTDADCIPDKFWLEHGYRYLVGSANCDVVGGNVVNIVETNKNPSIIETYQLITGFSQDRLIRERHYAVTANMFTRKEVLSALGAFDDSLKSSGDLEWGQRAYKAGYSLVYAHDAIVMHPVRRSLGSLVNQARRVAGGRFELRKKQSQRQLNAGLQNQESGRPPYLPISNPFVSLSTLWNDQRLTEVGQKLTVICIGSLIRAIGMAETLRLRLGGVAKR